VIEGPQTTKKLFGRGVYNAPLGRYSQNTGFFMANFTKKNLKNQGCILGKIFVCKVVANSISFPTMCVTYWCGEVLWKFQANKL